MLKVLKNKTLCSHKTRNKFFKCNLYRQRDKKSKNRKFKPNQIQAKMKTRWTYLYTNYIPKVKQILNFLIKNGRAKKIIIKNKAIKYFYIK